MSDREKLLRARQAAQSNLDDLEFERFAVTSGVAPKQLLEVSAQITAAEEQVQECDDALTRMDREDSARNIFAQLGTMKQSQFDEIFEGIVANLQ